MSEAQTEQKYARIVGEIKQAISNIDDFIDRSPSIRENLRQQYDEQIAELETKVEDAYSARAEYMSVLAKLGVELDETEFPNFVNSADEESTDGDN